MTNVYIYANRTSLISVSTQFLNFFVALKKMIGNKFRVSKQYKKEMKVKKTQKTIILEKSNEIGTAKFKQPVLNYSISLSAKTEYNRNNTATI